MASRIKISQAGLSAGVAGRSRTDGLATGALVTLEDVSGTGNSTFHLLWGPVEDTTAEASLAPTVDPDIWTFSPTAACYGSYKIELRDDGVPIERRIFGIRTPANHLLIPAYAERASRHAGWDQDGADEIEECEQNADDFPLSVLNGFRYAGWWRSLYELYRVVEFGIGSIADNALALIKLAQQPTKTVLANATSATGNVTALAGSAAFQYLRVNSANNGLEWGSLSSQASTSIVYDAGTNTFMRGALTGAVTANQNGNATTFGSAAAKSVLANATNGSAVPAFLAGSAAFQYLRVNSANNALEMATLSSHASTSIVYDGATNTFQAAAKTGAVTSSQNGNSFAFGSAAALSVLANATSGSAIPAFLAGAGALQVLRVNGAGNGLEFATPAVTSRTTPSTVTNSTSNNVGATYSVPANTFVAGTLYKFEGFLTAVRGATATACDLIFELTLGGTVYATCTVSIAASGGGSALVTGYLLCVTNGASGTFLANMKAVNDMADIQTSFDATHVWQLNAGSGNTAASGTTKNTTGALTMLMQARMSAAVANLSTTWTIAAFTPVN